MKQEMWTAKIFQVGEGISMGEVALIEAAKIISMEDINVRVEYKDGVPVVVVWGHDTGDPGREIHEERLDFIPKDSNDLPILRQKVRILIEEFITRLHP